MVNQFYTIDKIAEILGMHHKTIRKFITEGKLAASKVGKQWRISGHDLSIFMEKNNVNINESLYKKVEIKLTHGLIIKLYGDAITEYMHGIPKQENGTQRIGITFRKFEK